MVEFNEQARTDLENIFDGLWVPNVNFAPDDFANRMKAGDKSIQKIIILLLFFHNLPSYLLIKQNDRLYCVKQKRNGIMLYN